MLTSIGPNSYAVDHSAAGHCIEKDWWITDAHPIKGGMEKRKMLKTKRHSPRKVRSYHEQGRQVSPEELNFTSYYANT